ncbi:hypothetical protein ACFPRL_14080 [Pseudoclavibacter helvolus]
MRAPGWLSASARPFSKSGSMTRSRMNCSERPVMNAIGTPAAASETRSSRMLWIAIVRVTGLAMGPSTSRSRPRSGVEVVTSHCRRGRVPGSRMRPPSVVGPCYLVRGVGSRIGLPRPADLVAVLRRGQIGDRRARVEVMGLARNQDSPGGCHRRGAREDRVLQLRAGGVRRSADWRDRRADHQPRPRHDHQ